VARRRSLQDLLAEARAGLDRVDAADLAREMGNGALVVDIRPFEQRARDGDLPGAVVVDRNVLEWRLDPAGPDHIDAVTGFDQRVIIVCNEGYSSSLAAATLRQIGLRRAADLVGGFQAWRSMTRWDTVFAGTAPATVSWYESDPRTSVRLLARAAPPPASVVDVGSGTSFVADRLLANGWTDVTVLDVSAVAGDRVRDRLRGAVSVITADVLSWVLERTYDAWHDRAVFHFLSTPADRTRYADAAGTAVRPGGALVIATFAPDGPDHCSGLPTARYDEDQLTELFARDFTPEHAERVVHTTPTGAAQPFTWVVLRRRAHGA
jgi:rhodanese-related sulfurtransferase